MEVKMYNQNVPLSVRTKGHFLGPWAYAQRVIFWILEHTLKGSFFGTLSIHSKGPFLGPSFVEKVQLWPQKSYTFVCCYWGNIL